MKHRMMGWLGLALLCTVLASESVQGQGKPKGVTSKYGMDVRSRKFGEDSFGEKTQKYGVEIVVDENNSNALYLSEIGVPSPIPSGWFKQEGDKIKNPVWQHGLNLAVRKAGEKGFDKARRYGIEVLRDVNSGGLIYMVETGHIAVVPAKYAQETGKKILNPDWKASMVLKVRKAGEKDFTKDTKKVAVEVFLDENNSNLVYIADTGSMSIVPAKLCSPVVGGKDPEWQHGMELDARKVGEDSFTKDTKKYGIEVFEDTNTGNLIYLTETGEISVVPAKLTSSTKGATKAPDFKYGQDIESRKAGEGKFTEKTRKYAFEIYADNNNGNTIYISELGSIAVVGAKRD